ncbi:MAG: hypothetical protein ABI813_15980 [Bacteroidota bacterium]
MKQIFFLTYIALPLLAAAQNKNETGKSWNIELGPAISYPINYLNMFTVLGAGIDGAITHPLGNGLSVGARVNYSYFLGRSADPFFTGGGSHYKPSHLYDALGEVNYRFENKIIIGLNLGLGVLTFNGHSDPSFAQKAYAGYEWDRGGHPIIFAAFYEQTAYHKNAGLRASIRL